MPIEYQIDPERRLVLARGVGTFSGQDAFDYQRDVWSRPEVQGFNELVDMRAVEHIALPSSGRIQDLASLSAKMDVHGLKSKMAIVATEPLAFGLGRMYETYRELDARSTKEVAVFHSMEQALEWLEAK